MTEQTIHENLILKIPDGFTVQDEKSMARLFGSAGGDRWCAANEDESILLTVVWQKANPLLAMLSDMNAMARRNEQLAEKHIRVTATTLTSFSACKAKMGCWRANAMKHSTYMQVGSNGGAAIGKDMKLAGIIPGESLSLDGKTFRYGVMIPVSEIRLCLNEWNDQ